MSAEQYGTDILQQYENMIGNIAEWRTNIYSILHLAPWKKQQSPRMQSDITVIQNALMLPLNFEIGDFALQQVNIMINYKSLFEQLLEAHKKLISEYQQIISPGLLLELEQKTIALLTYFNYISASANLQCQPLCKISRSSLCKCQLQQQQQTLPQGEDGQTQEQSSQIKEESNKHQADDDDSMNAKQGFSQQDQVVQRNQQIQQEIQQKHQQNQQFIASMQQQQQCKQFQSVCAEKDQILGGYSQIQQKYDKQILEMGKMSSCPIL